MPTSPHSATASCDLRPATRRSWLIACRDVRHLRWLRERLGEDLADGLVVTTGPAAYRRPDGIGVVPAALLGP